MIPTRHCIAFIILTIIGTATFPLFSLQSRQNHAQGIQLPVSICFSKGTGIFVWQPGQIQPLRWMSAKDITFPSIAPSGQAIAYTHSIESKIQKSGSRYIEIQDGPSSAPRRIYGTPEHHCYHPVWSPNGELIMFNKLDDTRWGISIIDKAGSDYWDIIFPKNAHDDIWVGCWANDSKSLFALDFKNIYQIGIKGAVIQTISFKDLSLDIRSSDSTCSLSPDGNNLLLAISVELPDMDRFEFPVDVVYLLNLKTRKTTRLSPKGVLASSPIWLPDGKSFVFHGEGGIKSGIYRMDISSNQVKQIIAGASDPSLSLHSQ